MNKVVKKLKALPVLLSLCFSHATNADTPADTPSFLSDAIHLDELASKRELSIDSQRIDRSTAKALQAIARGELDLARATLQGLVKDYPNYRLGHLLFAELHAANTALPSTFNRSNFSQEFIELLLEASTRLTHSKRLAKTTFHTDKLPSDILKLGSGLKHWVQVDLELGTQSIFEINNGQLIKRWEQYVGYGAGGFDKFEQGDLKTPLGVYRIDGYRDDESLPELYGSGALTLDYPNLSDRYENRTGSGIWLHGVPRSNATRGPLSSEGCIIMGNDYLSHLHTLINPTRTLVALSSSSAIKNPNIEMNALETAFLNWQSQQESVDEPNVVVSRIQWSDITVVMSGASSLNGEPQNITMYFLTSPATSTQAQIKALFWQRQTPGSNSWQLVGDELKQSRT